MKSKTVELHSELIERCKVGDRAAQYEVYQLYQRAMFNTAVRICGSLEDAEDALQESFVSAFAKLSQYRAEASFGSWLKRIVINNALNFLNKQGKLGEKTELTEVNEPFYEWQDIPDYSVTIEKVKEAVLSLPAGFRSVLTLYLFEGYDHREIADIMGISESTSKSQFNRAKKKLREQLNEEVKYG
ncbi:MAG: RNA polymerase sigma factor [Cyclobacteriaceae bacterium]